MSLGKKDDLLPVLYMLRGAVSEESEPAQQLVAEAEEKTKVFIAQLNADYPDGYGLTGGLLAVINHLVKNGL
ncbi:hypothetical protein ABM398_004112 [Salmonella enterica]|nr:hypothetical protein [Salmonella enterica]EAY4772964.1 hypothetical protein [Salmonella enterica]EGP7733742.1 hypothetical protein [Salmonella enterica]